MGSAVVPTSVTTEQWATPAFSTGRGVVYNADCMDLLSALKDSSIDTVFADPPFNLGKDYGSGPEDDLREDEKYLSWCYEWILECIRILKPGGALFIYNLPRWSFHLATFLDRSGMSFRHWIAVSMKGTFPRGKKLYPAHYALLYFTKGEPNTFDRDAVRTPISECRHCGKDIKDYGGHRKALNPLGLNLADIWEDTSPARHSKFKARWGINELKPMIPLRCIAMSTKPGDVILDPFGGGGSTFEAAELSNRYWLGTEIVDCDLICERFSRNVATADHAIPSTFTKHFKQANTSLAIPLTSCPRLLKKSPLTVLPKSSRGSALKNSSPKSTPF